MNKIWCDYVRPKYDENANHFYMDIDRFIIHVKTDDIYKDIEEDVETKFNISSYESGRPFPKEKI